MFLYCRKVCLFVCLLAFFYAFIFLSQLTWPLVGLGFMFGRFYIFFHEHWYSKLCAIVLERALFFSYAKYIALIQYAPGSKCGERFLAATKQLYEWFSPSVCPSVCPSVLPSVTPFWLCSHHPIIMKFSGVITSDKSDVHAKGQGQRSKVKVTEVTTQLNRFRTVTPVWIHIWWWDDAYSLIMLRRGALLFFKVIRQISRSHGSKNRWIWPRLGVSGL